MVAILRFIINLIATNELCEPFQADINMLPMFVLMKLVLLLHDELLMVSMDDMKAMCHLSHSPPPRLVRVKYKKLIFGSKKNLWRSQKYANN